MSELETALQGNTFLVSIYRKSVSEQKRQVEYWVEVAMVLYVKLMEYNVTY